MAKNQPIQVLLHHGNLRVCFKYFLVNIQYIFHPKLKHMLQLHWKKKSLWEELHHHRRTVPASALATTFKLSYKFLPNLVHTIQFRMPPTGPILVITIYFTLLLPSPARILFQQIRSAGVRAVLQQIVLPDTVQLRAVLPDDHGPDVLLWVKFSRQSIQTGDASRGRCHGQFDGNRSGRGHNGDDHHRNRRRWQFVLRGDTDGHIRRDALLDILLGKGTFMLLIPSHIVTAGPPVVTSEQCLNCFFQFYKCFIPFLFFQFLKLRQFKNL